MGDWLEQPLVAFGLMALFVVLVVVALVSS